MFNVCKLAAIHYNSEWSQPLTLKCAIMGSLKTTTVISTTPILTFTSSPNVNYIHCPWNKSAYILYKLIYVHWTTCYSHSHGSIGKDWQWAWKKVNRHCPTIGMACVMLTLQKLQKAFKNLQYLHHVHKVLRLQPLPAHVIGQSSTLKAEEKQISTSV